MTARKVAASPDYEPRAADPNTTHEWFDHEDGQTVVVGSDGVFQPTNDAQLRMADQLRLPIYRKPKSKGAQP